jgi:GST-like protein
MAEVHLYHWEPNANSGKPMVTLLEKGVEFVSHYTDLLAFDQHQSGYLEINPNGTIPALVVDGECLSESTEMGEYIDATFDGPPLRPEDPVERWRMRWWGKFFDGYYGPSLSMIGWSAFVGPMARENRDPDELREAIERIPLKERRDAWSMAIYNTFPPEQMEESRRRVAAGTAVVEKGLGEREWFAGESYSLADINAFSMLYALPISQPELVNAEATPNLLRWLRRVYERPAVVKSFDYGRTPLAQRALDFMATL